MTKREFIPQFLEIIRRRLDKDLPDEDFEHDLLREAWEIVQKQSNRGERK